MTSLDVTWIGIGLVTGLVMGLTGAGGAIVSIPLFRFLADLTFREASLYSLVGVLAAAALNSFIQRKQGDIRTALTLVAGSWLASPLATRWKEGAADWTLESLFLGVVLICLFAVWVPKRPPTSDVPASAWNITQLGTGLIAGAGIGVLTVLTGIGGGVLLVPVLYGGLRLPLEKAVATSLLAITLSVLGALYFQRATVWITIDPAQASMLAAGVLLSVGVLRLTLKKIPPHRVDLVRKWVFTAVVLVAVVSTLIHAW